MADWITMKQAAEISGYHPKHLGRLIRAGKIKAQKWGRDWQISRASLLAYIHKAEKSGAKRGPKTGT
jgi:excisionase family DNA binding protein